MTIDTKILPAHVLRLYVWELLKTNMGMTLVNGRTPIIPVEDEPMLADSGKTYMIYGFAEVNGEAGLREIRRGVFSLRIMARGFGELGEITAVVSRALERGDASAENVNLWSSGYGTGSPLVGIRFTNIEVTYTEGGDAADSEGGPVPGLINVSYRCVVNHEVTLPYTGGLWWDKFDDLTGEPIP